MQSHPACLLRELLESQRLPSQAGENNSVTHVTLMQHHLLEILLDHQNAMPV